MISMANDYTLVNWDYVEQHQSEFISDLTHSHEALTKFGIINTTGNYHEYNIFGATSPSVHMYKLFSALRAIIRDKLGYDDRLWIQSWVNFHTHDQVLDWHNHDAKWHGYVSIDPKDTTTEFERGFKIENKVGNIYLGPGYNRHRVVNNSEYDGVRITIGFDVLTDSPDTDPSHNFGCIPLL